MPSRGRRSTGMGPKGDHGRCRKTRGMKRIDIGAFLDGTPTEHGARIA